MDDHAPGVQQIIINEDGEEFSIDVDPCSEEYDVDETSDTTESEKHFVMIDGSLSPLSKRRLMKRPMPTIMTTSKPVSSAKALLDGKFFSIVAEFYGESRNHRKIRKIKAKCALCPKPSYITCSYDSTSNFLRHIKLKHGKHTYESYLAYKKSKALNSNCSNMNIPFVPAGSTSAQPTRALETPSIDKVQKLVDRFQMKLLNFMINAMQPLSLVDNPHFRDLFPEVLTPMVSGAAVGSKIEDLFNICRSKIKDILTDVKYICLTVDIWTEKISSFVGFTSHWMTNDFEKRSAVLACNRLTDISLDNFIHRMNEVFNFYNLKKEQIVAIVTENTYNYVELFQELKLKCFSNKTNETHSLCCADHIDDENLIEAQPLNVAFHSLDIESELQSTFASMKNIYHVLNTFAIVDYKCLLSDYDVISKIHESTLGKCDILWNQQSQKTSKEKIVRIFGNQLPLPSQMRWKPFYNALKALAEAHNKLPELCQELDTEEFSPEEIEYLQTYVSVMNPLAAAMETLDGESVYFGYVLPTLLTVRMKFEESCTNGDSYTAIIAKYMLETFTNRFRNYLRLDTSDVCVQQAILASVSHPKVKMRWISNDKKTKEIKELFVEECSNLTEEKENHIDDVEDDEFFAACLQSKDVTTAKNEMKSSSELEVLRFIASKDKQMDMLHSYPSVKLVFLKYNSLLTSSLPVEKLFTFESLIHRDSSARAAEVEAYLFLKGNSSLLT